MPRFDQRRDKLRRLVKQAGADAILITNYVNVTYLTGFTGDDSYLLLDASGQVILSDPRYTEQLEGECPGVDLEIRQPGTKMLEAVERVVRKAKPGKLAVEASSLTLATHGQLSERLTTVELVPTTGLVEQLREIKDADEIVETREAIRLAEKAFAVVKAGLTADQSERSVAADLEHLIRKFGGTRCSFPPIVAVGPRAALPHARATDRLIGDSDFVLIDWGAQGRLYMSDLTRVLVTGKIPPKLERIYGVVLNAQLAGIAAIRPGALLKDVDAAARNVISAAGFGKQFGHGLGHGIGLEIHESPRLAVTEDRPLKAGMIVTVEPGIYVPGWGGVRIEDDVLVTRDGHEVMTSVPKEFADCVLS